MKNTLTKKTTGAVLALAFSLGAQSMAMGTKSPTTPTPTPIPTPIPTPTPTPTPVPTPAPGADYSYIDPHHVVPSKALQLALSYYDKNKTKLGNTRYLTVIDFSQHADNKRMYVVNMKDGSVETLLAAHGSGSDTNNDGYAEKFSNTAESKMTSLGIYVTDDTYSGSHGLSLYLDGKSSTNSNARSRSIVMHGAEYVNEDHVGRSWGCPAVDMKVRTRIINALKGGSVIFAYHKNYF